MITPTTAPTATIIRDTRDATLDYTLPLHRAKELWREGKLVTVRVYASGVQYLSVSGEKVQ